MTTLELFTKLGLPSAVAGMVLVALLFKSKHPTEARWAAVTAVILMGVFGAVQLFDYVSGEDIAIKVNPDGVYALSPQGPSALTVSATQGSSTQTMKIAKPSQTGFEARLRDLGWKPATECATPSESTPRFWSTNRVYVGQTQRLGQTRFGMLKIHAEKYSASGDAAITLILDGHKAPIPNLLEIKNKGLDVQSFEEVPEFYVAVREADFQADPPWAAFSVFSMQ